MAYGTHSNSGKECFPTTYVQITYATCVRQIGVNISVENRISVLFSQINLHSCCCVSGTVSIHVDVTVDYFL